jgi:nucleoid-associated protein YgaU
MDVASSFARLEIKVINPSAGLKQKIGNDGIIQALFNPTSYSISKPVTWKSAERSQAGQSSAGEDSRRDLNAPPRTFGGGGSRTLSLKLFYDATEPVNEKTITDVREETNKIVALTRIDRSQTEPQPPLCEVSWGDPPAGSDFPFKGYVSNLTQNFTLFKGTGEVLRAELDVTFTEHLEPEDDKKETDPELTTRVVKRSDTLAGIAADVYNDPAQWRAIAEANQLDDPRRLEVGTRLSIPDVR